MRVSGCWRQLGRERGEGVLLAGCCSRGAARGVLLAGSGDGVLLAASVGIALSPSASVVVLHKSDFLAYYC
jgi:hypothetical protein